VDERVAFVAVPAETHIHNFFQPVCPEILTLTQPSSLPCVRVEGVFLPSFKVIRIRWAVYISSRRDFSQHESRKAVAHEMRSWAEGQEKRRRFVPAVLRVMTLVYLRGGDVPVAGCVRAPKTCTN